MAKELGLEQKGHLLSKQLSYMIKGVAILMMLAHHCFAFPEYWLDTYSVGLITTVICNQFKICVAIFAFITGYGFCAGKERRYRDTLWKAMNFLGQYWLQLFLIFLPIASASFSFSAKRILYNLIALYDNIILFAWYVFFHVLVMLSFPLVKRLLGRGLAIDSILVIFGGYGVTVLFYFLPFEGPLASMLLDCSIYYPVVGMGYICARYAVLDRIAQKLNVPGAIGMIVLILLLRTKLSVVKGFSFDTFYAPMLILSLCLILEKCRFAHGIFAFLGKHSFHMWLFHSIFFSAYTRNAVQPLVTWTDIPVIRFLLITCMSLGVAVLIDRLWSVCTKQLRRITVK